MFNNRLNVKTALYLLAAPLVIAAPLIMNSCSSSNSSSSGPQSYTGAGSQWSATLTPNGDSTNGTFVVTHAPSVGGAVDMTVNGTTQSYSTGFLVLTVTSASGTSTTLTPPAAGATFAALNVPGYVLLVTPMGGNANITPMLAAGTCPTGTLNMDWIQVKPNSGWSASTDSVAGSFTYNSSTGVASVPAQYLLGSASSTGSMALGTGTCSNGIITGISGGGGTTADIFLTNGGGAIVHTATNLEGGGGDGIVLALNTPSAAISIPTLAGNYSGLSFNNSSTNPVIPVSLTLTASGGSVTGSAYVLSNVTSGQTGTGGAAVVLNNAGPNNMLTGTIDTTGPTGGGTPKNFTCIVQQNAGGTTQTILSCDGTDQSGNFFNALLLSH